MRPLSFCCVVILALTLTPVWVQPVIAQEGQSCALSASVENPAREIFTCGDAVTVEREPSAALRIIERSGDPAPRRIEVEGGAILIQIAPGSAPTTVKTPHAIATVRGTSYVIDVSADQSSVFVIEGAVTVQRVNDASTVTLNAGEGTDVSADTELSVKTWGAARAQALLARFGR